jgi:tetratricopeptide (TPR) repeat protein
LDSVRSVFSWSYHGLSEPAAALFRLLAVHPGPDVTVAAAASLVDLPAARVRPVLVELADAHLVEEYAPGRFRFHDLLRAYAGELATSVDSEAERRSALGRLLSHYVHTGRRAALLMVSHRQPLELEPEVPSASVEEFADSDAALAWFTAEHRALLALIDRAARDEFPSYAWQLAWNLVDYLHRQGHWHDWAQTQETALACAQRLADRPAQAYSHRLLSFVHALSGVQEDAEDHGRRATALYTELGDHEGAAHTLLNLAGSHERQGRHRDALRDCQEAARLFQTIGHQVGEARALNSMGWCHIQLGDHRQAIVVCRRALALLQEVGERHGEASTWDSLGYAHHHLGDHDEAATSYRRALTLFRELGDRYNEADTLTRLGETEDAAGDVDAARLAWEQALAILSELRHPGVDGLQARLASIRHLDR